MKVLSALLLGLPLLMSGVGCCCQHLCGAPMCAPACPPAYPANPCAPCPTGGCPPGMMPGAADPFGPPVIQPQGYYGAYNTAPAMPQMAVGPYYPQTVMAEPLPTY